MADSRVFPEPGKPALVQPEGDHYFCRGDWTLAGIEGLDSRLAGVNWPNKDLQLDGSGIGAIDTTGALRLLNLVAELERAGHPVTLIGLRPEQR
ncbi:MAG: STAS domain-containing protein, partial [Candidatus Competibacter denitrificans]